MNTSLTLSEFTETLYLTPEQLAEVREQLIKAAADDGEWLVNPVTGDEHSFTEKYWADLMHGIKE